jgi:hypothetical protein
MSNIFGNPASSAFGGRFTFENQAAANSSGLEHIFGTPSNASFSTTDGLGWANSQSSSSSLSWASSSSQAGSSSASSDVSDNDVIIKESPKVDDKKADKPTNPGPTNTDKVISLDDEVKIEEEYITLITSEDSEYKFPKKWLMISKLCKTILESDTKTTSFKVNIKNQSMGYIEKYINQHKGTDAPIIPHPIKGKDLRRNTEDHWNVDFIDNIMDKHSEDYQDLILAANYMMIDGLISIMCAKIASMMRGVPLNEINTMFSEKKFKELKTGV